MGFFDKLFGKKEAPKPAKPAFVTAAEGAGVICAPATGAVVAMANIPDPVFASGAMGLAVGVNPSEGMVYSPVSGTVTATMPGSMHAVGISSDDGIEILIHIGVDTVEMKGDGFTNYCEKGDHVVAGEPLIGFDLAKIAAAGHPDCVICVVMNGDEFKSVEVTAEGDIAAGTALIQATK